MLTLPLEPTDDRANPAFKDAAACAQWLGQLQLTNLHQAHGVLRTQLDELNRYAMRGLERLHTLETLRETIISLQADYARKLAGKRLPLSSDELAIFTSIITLWQSMVTGYQRCLQSWMAGDAQLAGQGPLLGQRCLFFSGQQILEHLHSGYEVDGKQWRQLHALYGFCEEQNWQLSEVEGQPGAVHASSCSATYVKTLLIFHAYRADLPRHQLHWLDHWLTQWVPFVSIERHYKASKGDAPPLAVDLGSSLGLQLPQFVPASGNLRYLVMVPLSKLIRVKNILLQQGQSPQQLELGVDCDKVECAAFLTYLHHIWCEGHDNRTEERHAGTQQAQVCYGLESCFSYIAGRPFHQPGKDPAMDTLARKQIAAFGRVLSESKLQDLAEMGYTRETWRIEDENIRGVRMLREEDQGMRLCPNLLMAIRAGDAGSFMAGAASWAKVTLSGQLHAGVRYLPGTPEAVYMRATGVNLTVSEKYVPALLLPALPDLNIPPSLVAPRDWFKSGRVVEVLHTDKSKQLLKMDLSIEKGLDYERIGFTEI